MAGTYRLIDPANLETVTVSVTMDGAGNPQVTTAEGTESLSAGTETCTFTAADGSSVAVSKSGLAIVAGPANSGIRFPALLFPDQSTTTIADLDGLWNRIEWTRDGTGAPFVLNYGTVSFTAGTVTSALNCPVTSSISSGCTPLSPPAGTGFTADAAGGFSGTGGLSGARAFAFKNGNDRMVVSMDPDGSLMFLTPQTTWGLPTVGTSSASWGMRADTAGAVAVAPTNTLPGISSSNSVITSVDANTGTVTRNTSDDGAPAVSQTLHVNAPVNGFRKRDGDANSSNAIQLRVTSDLVVVSRLGATAATTPGTGNGFLNLSLTKP